MGRDTDEAGYLFEMASRKKKKKKKELSLHSSIIAHSLGTAAELIAADLDNGCKPTRSGALVL